MRVLHVCESVLGGSGTYLNEVVPRQTRALGSDSVRCLVPRQHLIQIPEIAPECLYFFERSSRWLGLPHLFSAISQAVDRFRPSLIHAHSTFAGGAVRVLGLTKAMPPIVYCPHGWVFDAVTRRWQRGVTERAERFLARRTAAVVAISEAERTKAIGAGIPSTKVILIPNGVSATFESAVADWPASGRLRVLFVGRLDRQKGVDVLLDAVESLGDLCSVRIVGGAVVGDHSLRNSPSHVDWLGWLSPTDVSAQINAADVIVMPSRWEGFGLVAIEAMRAGKAVIASAVGGLVDIVEDGVTGRLVPPEDALALRLAIVSATRETLARWGQAGKARFVERFTVERTVRELLGLYERLHSGRLSQPEGATERML